ncbi:MAG TPA: sodium:solute symporter family protein [Desulfuromonadales bacterium]|nr:sodium:solute symporter family protein [Desulfuromonadales bacterium]
MKPLFVVLAMLFWSVVAVGIAAAARRGMGEGAAEFFIGGRRLKGFVSGMTYAATTYSAFMLVGLVGLTYDSGVGALGFEMTYLIFTVLFLLVFGPRFWLVGRRFRHITPPELLGHRYENRWVAVLTAIISFVMLIPYASVQLMGAGLLVNGLSGGEVPFMAGVLVMAGLSGFCALWAGMRSVSWTDAFQAVTMLVTSLAALFYMFHAFYGSPAEFFVTMEAENPDLLRFTWEPAYFIGLTLPWAFFALTNPQVSQRLFVPDRVIHLKRMILYFSVFGFIYTIISTLFGLQAANLFPGLDNPDQAMPHLLSQVPSFLGLIIFIGIFAAATSTLGSIVLTLSSLFSRDVVKYIKPDLSEKGQTRVGKGAMVCLLAICAYFAWLRPGLIAVLSSMASGGLLVMAPSIIGAFFWRRASAAGALCSMLVGGPVTAVLYLTDYYPLGWWPPVWGLGLTTLFFFGVSLMTSPPQKADQFISELEEDLREEGFVRSGRRKG